MFITRTFAGASRQWSAYGDQKEGLDGGGRPLAVGLNRVTLVSNPTGGLIRRSVRLQPARCPHISEPPAPNRVDEIPPKCYTWGEFNAELFTKPYIGWLTRARERWSMKPTAEGASGWVAGARSPISQAKGSHADSTLESEAVWSQPPPKGKAVRPNSQAPGQSLFPVHLFTRPLGCTLATGGEACLN